jgi:hypothetical protein
MGVSFWLVDEFGVGLGHLKSRTSDTAEKSRTSGTAEKSRTSGTAEKSRTSGTAEMSRCTDTEYKSNFKQELEE